MDFVTFTNSRDSASLPRICFCVKVYGTFIGNAQVNGQRCLMKNMVRSLFLCEQSHQGSHGIWQNKQTASNADAAVT